MLEVTLRSAGSGCWQGGSCQGVLITHRLLPELATQTPATPAPPPPGLVHFFKKLQNKLAEEYLILVYFAVEKSLLGLKYLILKYTVRQPRIITKQLTQLVRKDKIT